MNPSYHQSEFISSSKKPAPLRMGIVGLCHDHVRWLFDREDKGDVVIIGIAEQDEGLRQKYIRQYNLDESLFYSDLEEMLQVKKPEAICVFTSIDQHLEVVRKCAPLGIHVMVEKPLAFKIDDAREMEQLAGRHKINLLTNFQTSWYASTHFLHELAFKKEVLGDVWKVVFHDGHKGPKERGCSDEFLNWLTDPSKNGAGALIDFGCYGPNIMSWMLKGERPISVMASAQTIKPEIYAKVDDDAVILLEYKKAQVTIQASWNWPFNRKDIEIYGKNGMLIAEDHQQIRYRKNEVTPEEVIICSALDQPFDDPFSYFASVIAGKIKPDDYDLSSLPLNILVVEILQAAIESSRNGQKVYLEKNYHEADVFK